MTESPHFESSANILSVRPVSLHPGATRAIPCHVLVSWLRGLAGKTGALEWRIFVRAQNLHSGPLRLYINQGFSWIRKDGQFRPQDVVVSKPGKQGLFAPPPVLPPPPPTGCRGDSRFGSAPASSPPPHVSPQDSNTRKSNC